MGVPVLMPSIPMSLHFCLQLRLRVHVKVTEHSYSPGQPVLVNLSNIRPVLLTLTETPNKYTWKAWDHWGKCTKLTTAGLHPYSNLGYSGTKKFSLVFHMLTNADSTTLPHMFLSHPVPFSRTPVALLAPLFWADIFFGLIFVITYADPIVLTG